MRVRCCDCKRVNFRWVILMGRSVCEPCYVKRMAGIRDSGKPQGYP